LHQESSLVSPYGRNIYADRHWKRLKKKNCWGKVTAELSLPVPTKTEKKPRKECWDPNHNWGSKGLPERTGLKPLRNLGTHAWARHHRAGTPPHV